ncbi:MAG: hypothetical protein H7319_05460 [Spirosoma sp.]|nr:hypothetical protein [Spirosoma sp.]
MGAYLNIGLRARLSVTKTSDSAQTDNLRKLLSDEIDLFIYDEVETPNQLIWSLKASLVEQELVPFLKKQFDLIPNPNKIADREEMLTELQTVKTLQDLEDWYDTNESYVGRWNPHDSFTIHEGRSYHHVSVATFVFLSAGKISMEGWGSIFDYFERLITVSNPEFLIAKAAAVSIS